MKTKIYSSLSTKHLVMYALFIALNIVFTRLMSIQLTPISRFSLGNIPVILAGMLLGPVAGIIVGGIADFLGTTMLSPYPWYPPMMFTPMLIGLISGTLWKIFKKRKNIYIGIIVSVISAEVIASWGWQTQSLVWLNDVSFFPTLFARLPVSILIMAVDTFMVCAMYKAKVFDYINKNKKRLNGV